MGAFLWFQDGGLVPPLVGYQDRYDAQVSIGNLSLIANVGMVVGLVAWLSRTVEIIPALGGGTPRWSPRWAIAWWLIPIAFLFMPYIVLRDALDRLSLKFDSRSQALLLVWWLSLVAALLLSRWSATWIPATNLDEHFRWYFTSLGLVQGLVAVAMFGGVFVVRGIQRLVDLRAVELGFATPPPSLPHAGVEAKPAAQLSPGADVPAAEEVLFCPTCGTRRRDAATFCVRCGTRLE
jgi:hypothetical protein